MVPIIRHKQDKKNPIHYRNNQAGSIPRRSLRRPQLWESNTARTVTNKIHCIDDGSLRVAPDIRRVQTRGQREDTRDARAKPSRYNYGPAL